MGWCLPNLPLLNFIRIYETGQCSLYYTFIDIVSVQILMPFLIFTMHNYLSISDPWKKTHVIYVQFQEISRAQILRHVNKRQARVCHVFLHAYSLMFY
jgi:hypothetical protein